MATSSFLILFVVLPLSLALSVAATDTVSCVLFKDYMSPGHTYKISYTASAAACCKDCSEDDKCVAWTRDVATGNCALKSDCDILFSVAGAETGVKYVSSARPTLKFNGVGASVIIAKEKTETKPRTTVVSASASAVSRGGSSIAEVSADDNGISSKTSVTGDGEASTSASNPTLSLATKTVAKDGETSKLAVSYFRNVTYLGTVPLIGGKIIQIITNAVDEPPCLSCSGYKCISVPGAVYKGGKVIHDTETKDEEECCQLCRESDKCISWWRNSKTKRCVLNSDYPAYVSNSKFHGGTFF
eukprot:g8867.t1